MCILIVFLSFLKVLNFWKDLEWPDREQSIGYFATVVQVRERRWRERERERERRGEGEERERERMLHVSTVYMCVYCHSLLNFVEC